MNSVNLEAYIDQARALGVLGVNVTVRGEQIVTWRAEEECRRLIHSAAKSFTAMAVGFAVQEGLVSLEEKLTDAFADELPGDVGENLQKATVRDLLTMHLGHAQAHLMAGQRPFYEEDDWVKLSLSQPFAHAPGERFVYNNVGPYLAGVLVQRRAGCDLVQYLTPRLFAPLGIKRPTWECDPLGNTFGAGGLFLTLTELHRFGLFCLNRGKWNGVQLLDPAWIDACAAPQDGDSYGYLFWRGEFGSFRADGKYGQLSIILPEKNAVVTVVCECRDGEGLTRLINGFIAECL